MCDPSPECQPYPVLHQKKRSQQVEGGDSPPQLFSSEHPALESSGQDRHGPAQAGPEEGHKNIPPVREGWERWGCSAGRSNALGRIYFAAFKYLKEVCKEDGDRLFSRVCYDRINGNDFKVKESRFRPVKGGIFSSEGQPAPTGAKQMDKVKLEENSLHCCIQHSGIKILPLLWCVLLAPPGNHFFLSVIYFSLTVTGQSEQLILNPVLSVKH